MYRFRWAILAILLLAPGCWAADRATTIRESVVYLSPATDSAKLANASRGRELVILESTRGWVHVEALLGFTNTPDPAMIEDEDAEQKTVTGWIQDKGIVRSNTPDGDKIIYGEAVSSEDQASRAHGRRGAAQDAMRLYRRVYDEFPASPLAGEALYRAADVRWQIEKSDVMSRPSAKAKEAYLREGMNEEWMKTVIKKFPNTKWSDLAAFHLIDNKLCGDWQASSKCPEKEAEIYEKYVKEHSNSPAAAQALYEAAWRRAALIEIYKTETNQKKSDESRNSALALAQRVVSQYPQQTDWAARAQTLVYMIQQNIPTYGNVVE